MQGNLPIKNYRRFKRTLRNRIEGLVVIQFLILGFGLCCQPNAIADEAKEDGLQFKVSDDGVLVTDNGTKVLFYQQAPQKHEGAPARAHYVHPLYGLDGEELTEDCPKDHPHHRGIFWAWHQLIADGIVAGDSWVVKNFEWQVDSVTPRKLKNGSITLKMVVQWKSAGFHDGEKSVMRERSQITIYPLRDGRREIDFDIRLRSNHEVRIGGSDNVKGYGGFSLRLKLPKDIAFTNETGPVIPMTTAVGAAPWMTMTGFFTSTQPSSVTVMTHPDSAGYPQSWILRASRSMQNPVWPGRTAVPLDVTRLRYRVVLHPAYGDPQKVRQWYDEWTKVGNAEGN